MMVIIIYAERRTSEDVNRASAIPRKRFDLTTVHMQVARTSSAWLVDISTLLLYRQPPIKFHAILFHRPMPRLRHRLWLRAGIQDGGS